METIIILFAAICVFHWIDYCETFYAIQNFGIEVELNPIARFWFENNCAFLAKAIGLSIVLAIMGICTYIDRRFVYVIYAYMILSFCVIIYNFITLIQLSTF